ncbi:MAG: hypothetical protein ACYC8T_22260 [Myxococcaceae bacterium]
MFMRRRFSLGAALIAGCIVLGGLMWNSYVARRDEGRARSAAVSACVISGVPEAKCKQTIEANSADCHRLTYTPGRGKSRYSAAVPARFDAAGYQECVLSSPPEWAAKQRAARPAQ